jgi:PAS domain S-box-containing protein
VTEEALIVRSSSIAIAATDLAGKMTFVNPAFVQIWGFDSATELLGRPFSDFWVLEDVPDEIIADLLRGHDRWSGETQARRKDGSAFDVQVFAGTVLDDQGCPIGFTASSVDSMRKRVSEELRESEDRYFQIFEKNRAVKLIVDPVDGRIIEFNAAAQSYYGYDSEALAALRIMDINTLSDEEVRREMKRAECEDRLFFRFRHRLATGEVRDVEVYSGPLRSGDKTLLYSIVHDVTERKQAEERATRFSRALESSLNEIYIFDADTYRFLEVNRGARDNLGYSVEELRALTPLDLEPALTLGSLVELLEPLRTGERELLKFAATHRRKDGSSYPVDVFLQLLSGTPSVFIAIVLDTTEQKRAEEERANLERQLLQAQKLESLGVLAGGVAHDFNNILVAVLGNAELALGKLSPEDPACKNVQEIAEAAKRAADLANQMLAYSGKGSFVIESIDLNELIREMLKLASVSIPKNIAHKLDLADDLPGFDGDATQIRRVVMNLVINAAEAIEPEDGSIVISTRVVDCERSDLDDLNEVLRASLDEPLPEGLYICLEVTDTGCGMDFKTVERIFDPFFTTKFAGRGLGMSAVLGIVRGHRGIISVHSTLGSGTVFKVLFPVKELTKSGPAPQKGDLVSVTDWRGSGTVLLADDEEAVRIMAKQMLEHLGFTVLVASDGRESLELFRAHADEVVCLLLDFTMPYLDGLEVLREIRHIRPRMKAVLCSGYSHKDFAHLADQGPIGFLQKPYGMAALKQKLQEALG